MTGSAGTVAGWWDAAQCFVQFDYGPYNSTP